jgi:hypothetical protein
LHVNGAGLRRFNGDRAILHFIDDSDDPPQHAIDSRLDVERAE